MDDLQKIEEMLDSFDGAKRRTAIKQICDKIKQGEVKLPPAGKDVNLHCHTFYSFNCYGYSPSKFAWLARKSGLAAAGIIDFDVLDGVDEFLDAAQMLGLKYCCGMETRVFVPEFASRVINSPGEPGVAYHMGIGFVTGSLNLKLKQFQRGLFDTAQNRNRELISRVNSYLQPVELDYEQDVLPLTPGGNATERHICLAYAKKAGQLFKDPMRLAQFWTQKLAMEFGITDVGESVKLLNAIRAKTMKRGGIGYVQPGKGSFVMMDEMNRFVLECGGIPTLAWLDGTTEGEKAIEELIDIAKNTGVAAINIIPDRNYTVGLKDAKLQNLYAVVEIANRRNMPVIVGTEMNSPGNKFVDKFDSSELKPLVPVFLKGAHIVYAHSVLEKKGGMGYTSDWARKHFENVAPKNEFFEELGKRIDPARESCLDGITETASPETILNKIKTYN